MERLHTRELPRRVFHSDFWRATSKRFSAIERNDMTKPRNEEESNYFAVN